MAANKVEVATLADLEDWIGILMHPSKSQAAQEIIPNTPPGMAWARKDATRRLTERTGWDHGLESHCFVVRDKDGQ
jgi:hypothetical protein